MGSQQRNSSLESSHLKTPLMEIVDLAPGLGLVQSAAGGFSGLIGLAGVLAVGAIGTILLLPGQGGNDDDDSTPGGGLMQPIA